MQDVVVDRITGAKGAFQVAAGADTVNASRVLLCTGMIDEMLPLDGFRELWGHTIVQCPYCHGWESRDRPWGYLARPDHAAHLQMFALQLRGWTNDVCVFTNGDFELPAATQHQVDVVRALGLASTEQRTKIGGSTEKMSERLLRDCGITATMHVPDVGSAHGRAWSVRRHFCNRVALPRQRL